MKGMIWRVRLNLIVPVTVCIRRWFWVTRSMEREDNRRYLNSKGIRFAGKPLGRPKQGNGNESRSR